MSIRQFQQEFTGGMSAPVYLLHSPEDFLLYEALSAIKERNGGDDAFNFNIYDFKSSDDSAPVEQIVDTLNTLPFLAERRTVALKNIQKLAKKEAKKLEEYLSNPSPTSLLVMLHEGAAPKFFDPAALRSVKIIALTVQEKEIPLWLKANAKKKGIALTDKAVEFLITIVGTDLGMLAAEVEKLTYWDKTGAIDVTDIKGTVYSGVECSAFDLADALRQGNATEVFRTCENIVRNQEPQMVLGALNYQYARQMAQAGPGKGTVAVEVFRLLHEADVAIKTSHRYVLEDLLVKLLRRKGGKGAV
jgi:DNA polymerase-3 subunit delta